MMKKITSIFLAIFMSISMNCISASASDIENTGTEIGSIDYGIDEYTENYTKTAEYHSWIDSFHNIARKYEASGIMARTGGSKTLPITGYKQENDYYCGPACAQIVIKYMTGTKYSQSVLAAQLGTTPLDGTIVHNMVQVINSYAGSGIYNSVKTHDVAFSTGVIASLEAGYPVLAHTNSSYLACYSPASNLGHYVVIYGYRAGWYSNSYVAQITYFDPYDNGSGSYGTHTISFEQMNNAINAKAGLYIAGK